jgi:hypothetical protein
VGVGIGIAAPPVQNDQPDLHTPPTPPPRTRVTLS